MLSYREASSQIGQFLSNSCQSTGPEEEEEEEEEEEVEEGEKVSRENPEKNSCARQDVQTQNEVEKQGEETDDRGKGMAVMEALPVPRPGRVTREEKYRPLHLRRGFFRGETGRVQLDPIVFLSGDETYTNTHRHTHCWRKSMNNRDSGDSLPLPAAFQRFPLAGIPDPAQESRSRSRL
ncbi:hypothetical protein Baya_13997 [Bagarius yarrelli]|uniref:Uncharacterized protein n=1 Tax=Bagarius yarrelli TaxID=175774 RepID=A0A556V784_BAGYA|nr:hypothetical protein Baya_13997 [Bagarius yarrelli]